jgi:hypothetical protein
MAKEFLPDGRVVEGGSTDVKGSIVLNRNEIDGLKAQMYKDFLTAKQEGKIGLGYTFDSWLRDSCNTLRSLRKADLETEYKLGRISKAEFDALDEMRIKMISAIIQMDVAGLDKYGVQYIDPTFAQMAAGRASPLDDRLLIPNHRKDVIKFKNEIKQ